MAKKLSDLTAHPRNPRKISDPKLKMLEKSLARFGDLSGFVWNVRFNRLVGGHQRGKVLPPDAEIHATPLKEKSKVGTVAAGHVLIDGERFAYREVDWDENIEKAAMIAANKHGGEWDFKILPELLLDLDQMNFDLELTGFDNEEMVNIMAPTSGLSPIKGEDDVPEPPKKATTKRGEVWQLGQHRLMCGDSTVAADVERLMNGNKASLWSSDPPYGINHVEVANEKGQAKGYSKIQNDELQDEELREFIYKVIMTSLPFMKDRFAFYMWHAMKMQAYFSQAAAAAGILFHRQIVWVKPQFVFGRGQYHWKHELCLMGWMKGSEPPFYGKRNQDTIWNIGRENDKIHPTQKPVEIFAIPIRNHLRKNSAVYEPFAGSGSNIIAAEKEGVRCFAMEIDPIYCDVIIKRYEIFAGKKAVLEGATKRKSKAR